MCFEQSSSDLVIQQLAQRFKTRQSQYISEYVVNVRCSLTVLCIPRFYTGMKWLKERAVIREEMLGKIRMQAYNSITTTLERKSHDCYLAARLEFGTATRNVRIPYFPAAQHILSDFISSLISYAKPQSSKIQKPCVVNYTSRAT